ncbi:Peptidase_C39 like family protein [Paenibacillus sophorae]|uniref:C39 family peptidase n=1 Tax=Paenibacillus sophorae TaxID=1333845 RepID=A0A1H8PEU8_9BACL|nr:C39 family peptidase [Paenibacillus sophorae]QWU16554.1 C39 family peptidase [Paenibacillus sophorae]SEO40492.1 Peptidase_C39 like family protein [Paenibacillus sophorae]
MTSTVTGKKLNLEPYTQWAQGVRFASSACGPATMAAITEYWGRKLGEPNLIGKERFRSKTEHINHLYARYGGRRWGMSARGFEKGIKAYLRTSLGNAPAIRLRSFNDFALYKAEIDAGRPVAVKFDKWFSLRWFGNYAYNYHWTVGTGYEMTEPNLWLIVQDNGSKRANGGFTASRERRIEYAANREVITMVAVDLIRAEQ